MKKLSATARSDHVPPGGILQALADVLASDDRLVVDGRLVRNRITELTLNLDGSLLRLLLSDQSVRAHFFTEVDGLLIFDKIKFTRFVNNKAFLPDSYTAYKNKIGLTVEGDYLASSGEVVLDWPYKDCVLEGGQDREDAKRDEVFWNETLAPDEIDRLLSPKVLTNFLKFTDKGSRPAGAVSLSDHLIVRGNNLLGLHTLARQFEGKIKVIYADPPYNTESDSFHYNDRFTHSTWLTFMRNRLEIARRLLTDDGIIFVSLDDKEAHYCKVMMDSIFGRENFVADICHKARASVSNDKIISSSHNHLLFYAKNERVVYENRDQFGLRNDLSGFDLHDEVGDYRLVPVDGPGGAAKGNPYYEFLGVTGYWRFSKETMTEMRQRGLIVKQGNTLMQKYYKEKARLRKKKVTTWWDEGFLTSSATSALTRLMGEEVFKNPKHVELLKRVIELWTTDGDRVLDFFAGSGTTATAALELAKEDGIHRQFILCEQIDYPRGLPASRVQKALGPGEYFIQCDLAKANQIFVEEVEAATTPEQLQDIWAQMQKTAFLSYQVDVGTVNGTRSNFLALPFPEQQRFLLEALDKNLLYVPLTEIDDESYGISPEDKALNRMFFGIEKA